MDEYIKREAALALVRPDAPEDEKAAVTIATAKKLVRDIVCRTPAADAVKKKVYNWDNVERVVATALMHENKVVINADW